MSNVQMVGVSVRGPRPLGWIHLPLAEGVAAFYGKNGAGKTRLLSAVGSALQGVQVPGGLGLVHLRAAEPDEIWGTSWRGRLEEAAATHVSRARAATIERLVRWRDENFQNEVWDGIPEEELERIGRELASEEYSPTSLAESIRAQVAALRIARNTIDDSADGWQALAEELANGGWFTLRAAGTEGAPRWDVYAGADSSMQVAAAVVHDQIRVLDFVRRFREGEFAELATERQAELFVEATKPTSLLMFPWDSSLTVEAELFNSFAEALSEVSPRTFPEPWPEWAARPLLKIAEIGDLPAQVVLAAEASQDADAATRAAMLEIAEGSIVDVADSIDVSYAPRVTEAITAITKVANEALELLLDPAPRLQFRSGSVDDWFAGRPPTWQMCDPHTSAWFSLIDASSAQRRWANIAIAIATERIRNAGRPVILLVDEPELGLHARAESQLPSVLNRFARDLGATIMVATHSAAMLDDARCKPVHIFKLDRTVARTMTGMREDRLRDLDLEELGLTRSAAFQLYRTFVLVEGMHDKLVLSSLIDDDLRAGAAHIIPMGGAKQLPSMAHADVLWHLTDARIVVVLDGIASGIVRPIWSRAQMLSDAGDRAGARRELRALEQLRGGEVQWLRAFLELAIDAGTWRRIELATLTAPDIICYLPPEEFVPGSTWDGILAAWRADAGGRPVDLKGYLQRTGHPVSIKSIERSLRSSVAHRDLLDVGAAIRGTDGG